MCAISKAFFSNGLIVSRFRSPPSESESNHLKAPTLRGRPKGPHPLCVGRPRRLQRAASWLRLSRWPWRQLRTVPLRLCTSALLCLCACTPLRFCASAFRRRQAADAASGGGGKRRMRQAAEAASGGGGKRRRRQAADAASGGGGKRRRRQATEAASGGGGKRWMRLATEAVGKALRRRGGRWRRRAPPWISATIRSAPIVAAATEQSSSRNCTASLACACACPAAFTQCPSQTLAAKSRPFLSHPPLPPLLTLQCHLSMFILPFK